MACGREYYYYSSSSSCWGKQQRGEGRGDGGRGGACLPLKSSNVLGGLGWGGVGGGGWGVGGAGGGGWAWGRGDATGRLAGGLPLGVVRIVMAWAEGEGPCVASLALSLSLALLALAHQRAGSSAQWGGACGGGAGRGAMSREQGHQGRSGYVAHSLAAADAVVATQRQVFLLQAGPGHVVWDGGGWRF